MSDRSGVISCVEFVFDSPLYFATHSTYVDADGVGRRVIDENGALYTAKISVNAQPVIQLRRSGLHYGTLDVSDATVEIVNLDESQTAAFRAECRGKTMIVRRFSIATGMVVSARAFEIGRVEFVAGGRVRVTAGDAAAQLLATQIPVHRLGADWMAMTADQPVDSAVAIVFGATREHVPAHFAGSIVGATTDASMHRFLVCEDIRPLSDTAVGTFAPLVRANINTVYVSGADGGLAIVGSGEWEPEWNVHASLRGLGGFGAITSERVGGWGSATATYHWKITAHNRFGLVATSTTVTIAAVEVLGVKLSWTPVLNAATYRVWRRVDSTPDFGVIATLCSKDTEVVWTSPTTWETRYEYTDAGGDDPYMADLPLPRFMPPRWTSATLPTQPNFIGLSFRYFPGYVVAADLEVTELGPTDETTGLWLFRNDLRNLASGSALQDANRLRTSRTQHLWTFKGAFAGDAFLHDLVGASDLVNGGLTADNLTGRHWGEQVLSMNQGQPGSGEYDAWGACAYLQRADSLDLELDATTSIRVEARVRPAGGTGGLDMALCGKTMSYDWGYPGWTVGFSQGAAMMRLRDDANTMIDCLGATAIDGGWHDVAWEVDRISQVARIYVDGALDAEVDLLDPVPLGSCVSSPDLVTRPEGGTHQLWGVFFVGTMDSVVERFQGDVDYLAILSGFTAPCAYGNGKADSGTNALDLSQMWEPPWIPGADAVDLEPGDEDFRVQCWFRPDVAQGGGGGVLVAKSDGANGYDLACEQDGSLAFHLHVAGTTYTATAASDYRTLEWNLATVLLRRGAGTLELCLNGEAATVVDSVPATAITTTADFVVGALASNGACKFAGRIDELHIERNPAATGPFASALDAHRHCYYLGMRNGVRQLRTLLAGHAFNAPLDATSWDQAEDDWAAVVDANGSPNALKSDYAIVEPDAARNALAEVLRLRGVRLGTALNGDWTAAVDQVKTVKALWGWQSPGVASVIERPQWRQAALRDVVRKMLVKYRRRRNSSGSVDRFLRKTARRLVVDVGEAEPTAIELPAIRDEVTGDLTADYTAKWMACEDDTCEFSVAGDAALAADVDDLVRMQDPAAGMDDVTLMLVSASDHGTGKDYVAVPWNADIYTYEPASDDVVDPRVECVENEEDVGDESIPDYSTTAPPPVISVSVSVDSDRLATVTWTKPATANYRDAVIGWRRKPETKVQRATQMFVQAGTSEGTFFVVSGIPAHVDGKWDTFEFRVESRNAALRLGRGVIVEADIP